MRENIPSRRELLKTVGTSGIVLGSAVSTTSARPSSDTDDIPNVEVVELSGKDRKSALKEVWNNDDLKALFNELRSTGYRHNRKQAQIWNITETDDETRHMAFFPFEKVSQGHGSKSDDTYEDQAAVIYTGVKSLSEEFTGVHNVESYQIRPVESDEGISIQNNDRKTVEVTRTFIDDDSLTTTTNIVKESTHGQENGVSIAGHDCNTCQREIRECNDVNNWCWLKHITAGIGAIGACYSCYQTAGIFTMGCGLCVNSVVGAGLVSCDLGEDCYSRWVCASDPMYC